MRPLVSHRFFLRFALSGAMVFAWAFLFQYFCILTGDTAIALAQLALLYALSSTVTCLVTPYAARALRGGVRRTIVYALLAVAGAFILLGSAFQGYWGVAYTSTAVTAFSVLLGLYRALYWIPYEVERAPEGTAQRSMTGEIGIALVPLIAGLYIAFSVMAPVWLFYIAAAIAVLSVVPLLSIRERYEDFSWGYRQTFHELLSREHRASVTHSILEGMSGAALLLFWPLAVLLLVGWAYDMLGAILSLTFLVAIFLRAPVRFALRRAKLQDSRLLKTTLAVTPWLFRLAIATPFAVVLTDSYFYTTTPRRLGVDPFTFEQVSDGGSLIDEYTALKEMALSIGRIAICILGAATALLFSAPLAFLVVFLVAALGSASLALKSR